MEKNYYSLENCKIASLTAETANYLERLNFNVEYAGAIYQADPDSYSKIIAATSQTELPLDFYWIDNDNNKVACNMQNLQELANVIFLKRFFLFKEHQNRKEIIKNATTVDGLFF